MAMCLKEQMESKMDAKSIYLSHVDMPYGKHFAKAVGRFQEGFLRDKTPNLDEAFVMAVDAAVRLLPAIKIRADLCRPA